VSTATTAGTGRARVRRVPTWERVLRNRLPGVLSFIGFIAIWQLLIVIFDPDPILFPTPGQVADEFVEAARDGTMWPAFTDSMSALGIGLLLALVTGVPLGLMIGMSPTTDLLTSPYLWGFFAMPRIALAPLMILWFGFGLEVKVWLVYLSAVIPLILSCKDGVQTADASLIQAARSFGASRLNMFAKVIAPSTLPFIASGIRNGISRGFVGLLVIELTVGSGGIGSEVMRSMRDFNTARMFAFASLLVIVALVLISASRQLERVASRWREEVAL
jgi:ABC-type nitrate/sulfonate/bicarbonate transport system permease component